MPFFEYSKRVFIFVSGQCDTLTNDSSKMQTSKGNMPYVSGSVLNRSEQLSFSVATSHYIGFYNLFFPSLILSRVIQNVVNMKTYVQTCRLTGLQKNDTVHRPKCKSSSQVIRGVSESAYVRLKVIDFVLNFQSFFLLKRG